MAAASAVRKSIGKEGLDGPGALAGSARPRRLLSRRESALLRITMGIAIVAVAISIVARFAPDMPVLAPIIAIALFIFGIGGIAGAALAGTRVVPLAREATEEEDAIDQIAEIIGAAPLGIALWDAKGRLIIANEAYCVFLELDAPEAIAGLRRDNIRAVGGRALENILATGDVITPRGRFAARRSELPDGGALEIVSDMAVSAAGNPEALRETRERIRHLVGEVSRLSQQVGGLQGEIENLEGQLTEERTRTEAAIRTKTEFLSHMSHELRTPLNAIIGFAEMMQSGIFGPLGNEKYEEYAADIHASGRQLLDKITDILDVSSIQSGDVPIERHRISLEEEIASCLSLLRPRIFASGIALTEIVDDLPTVFADPMAVRQILLHILSNAMKFTPTGGRISIKAEIGEEFVTIIIDDTGIGIAPSIMEKIDQPFSGLDRDVMISGDEGAGLGVGLAVSRALARLNGGALTIESEEGFGTTVRIALPRR